MGRPRCAATHYDQGHDRAAHEGPEACSTGVGWGQSALQGAGGPPGTGREGRGEGEGEGEDGGGVEPTPLEPSAMLGFPGSL